MEAVLLLWDVGLLIAVFAWAIKNGGVDGPPVGLFRFKNQDFAQAPLVSRARAPR